MRRRERLAFITTVLTGAALASCGGPAATPEKKAAAPALTEQWQRVAIGNSEMCPDRLACLVGFSGIDSPTIVSIKQVPFARLRGVKACMPEFLALEPGPDDISFGTFTDEALRAGVPTACPAFGEDRKPQQPYKDWRRSDSREPFEAQNNLSYSFLPLGSSWESGSTHVRCIVVHDPFKKGEARPPLPLREAAEICITLFYFRERQ